MQNQANFKNDQGFTLIELVVVLFIVGILAAIAIPNFINFFYRMKVNSSLEQLLGAIKETQRLAMRKGKRCQININPTNNLVTATPNSCLLKDRKIDDNIKIRTNLAGTPPNIYFSHKGNTTKMGTIVLSASNTNIQKCFVISLGLGIMRTGEYTGSKSGSILPSDCDS